MNLIEAFEKQAVSGILGTPDKTIETLISKLFFYNNKVYKIYKWNKAFFGDFSSLTFRKEFYQEDFFWNNAMAPHIYTDLKTVKFDGNSFVESNMEESEDLYIVMNKINEKDNLTHRLIMNDITTNDLMLIAREMTTKLKELTKERKSGLQNIVDRGLASLEQEIVGDLRSWGYMADPQYPKEKTNQTTEVLGKAFKKEKYFNNFKNSDLSIAVDSHSDNILFSNGQLGFIDIFPPRDIWRIVDPFYNICRLATDVTVLKDKDSANEMYKEYGKIMPLGPEKVKNIYELQAALIKGPYLSVLKRKDEAEKYFAFIEESVAKLN
jgi:aminoglycoside phosphotransferase family enzyme